MSESPQSDIWIQLHLEQIQGDTKQLPDRQEGRKH